MKGGTISSVGMSEKLNGAFVAGFSLCKKLREPKKKK